MLDIYHPAWQRERAATNHDWLQNRFLVALGKWENVRLGLVEDDNFEEWFVRVGLAEWPGRRSKMVSLLGRFEVEMSPAQIFGCPPLCSCDAPTRIWLSNVVHQLWLERSGVERHLSCANLALEEASARFLELGRALFAAPRGASLEQDQVLAELRRFRISCEQLAQSLSRFPSMILVV